VNIQFGGVKQNFTLDAKGKSPKGTGTVSLKGGSVLPSASAKAGALSLSIKGDLRTALVATGFANKTTAKEGESVTVSVALALIVGNTKYLYAGQVPLTYKATQGKSGKAANAK
jgi:hypothetical protein